MLLICHKVLVRLLNHFIQQFFWEDTTTSGNTFKLFVDFSGQFQRDGTISTFITPFLLLPGTFQLIKKNRFMLNPGAWKEACVNFALFRLGLLSSKNCTCCSFQPSQLSNVAQANQYFCSGVRGFSGFPHTGPAWRSITSHTVHCPCCPPTKRGRSNH